MSCSLVWRPIKESRRIGDHRLRDALGYEYGDWPIRLSGQALPFLRGLRAAGVEGAAELIEIIGRQGVVELDVEC